MDKNERRICWYSSLLIALIINSPKLLALREGGIMAQYWHFNPLELLFQFTFNLFFCGFLISINLFGGGRLLAHREQGRYFTYFGLNFLIFLVCFIIATVLQRTLFQDHQIAIFFISGSFFRLGLSFVLIFILLKIVLLMRSANRIETENQQLKNAHLTSELQLLKEQMNPHFLFNSLSSLSAIVGENPELAQKYIRDLSNIFRYALVGSHTDLVTLAEELTMLRSFAKLISMRLEDAFELKINVAEAYQNVKIPHLSLQPLLENAVKHNAATVERQLKVEIETKDDQLIFSNSFWEIPTPEASNGMGLANLNERFKIMMHHEIEISRSETHFIVKLPLKQ